MPEVGMTETGIQRGDYFVQCHTGNLWWSPTSNLECSAAKPIILITVLKSSLPGSNWTEDFIKQN